ncbi:NACHT, LRR and PYD domains-containing protein 3-like isoform X4 [Acanthaster planci]|nr:NACHT, LRR and PYD domains-containing protein 3-like isoform X4 [Acanthaster planci]XP_022085567.1 NACHT, LRR and PYD domains-containing protein 3-like isoform X4 [Acanthaster planci]XP_022085568.1 NACHT, LRR and PYD domains-containing protein 3-like isoform X4 [Acanthaster planci]
MADSDDWESRIRKRRRSSSSKVGAGVELDDCSLYRISEQIRGSEWKELAIRLGFSFAEITHIQADYHHHTVRCIFCLLVTWRNKQSDDINQAEALCKALKEIGSVQVADKLIEYTAPEVQVQAAANKVKEKLATHYKTIGSYLQLSPWVDDDRKHILDIYSKSQLNLGGRTGCRTILVHYEDIFLLKTEEDEQISIGVLTGLAGSGKTTLFNKIAFDWAVGSKQVLLKYELVFLLKMCYLTQSSDLTDAVFDQLLAANTDAEKTVLWQYIERNSCKVLILLDGFDEMNTTPLSKSSFGSILKILGRKLCRGCTVLVSTRPSHFHRLVAKELVQEPFTHVRVRGFDEDSIEEYVEKFYSDQPLKAKGLLERIQSSKLLSALAEGPMLLLLMCLLWREGLALPETISRLYHRAVEYIGWRKEVSKEEMSRVVITLGKVALHGLLSPHQVLSFEKNDFEPCALDVSLKIGIVTRIRVCERLIPYERIQFIHRTFQEFCAAVYFQSLFGAERERFRQTLNEIMSVDKGSFQYLLCFCCGDNEACTLEILKVFQERCKDLSFDSESGQLALRCYFEGQCKILPPKEFVSSFVTDSIFLTGLDSDSSSSVAYFLKCMAEQTGGRDGDYLAKVKMLSTARCDLTRCIRGLAFSVSAMTNLRHATFCECLTGECVSCLAVSLRTLTKLVTLELSHNNLRCTAFSWCPQLKLLKTLKQLDLKSCSLDGQDVVHVAEAISDLPSLVTLNFSGNNLTGTAELWCKEVRWCKTLQRLQLSSCSLNGQDMGHIAELLSSLPNLVELNLFGNNLGGTARCWCSHMRNFKTLQRLQLSSCSLNGQDMVHVAESAGALPNLVALNLSENNLAGRAALLCRHVKDCKALQKLDLDGCKLTREDKRHIRKSLSDLKANGLVVKMHFLI